jgi:hypothetical protein
MSDNAELHGKILAFLAGEWARKGERQLTGVDLVYAPGGGYREEEIRKWVRADETELFESFVNVEKLVSTIIEIAEGEADAKPSGKHRFVVRTHQHAGGRATQSFALSPGYNGADEMALVPGGGSGSRPDVIANHAGQLMRINAQMFEGTIRVLGQQHVTLYEEVAQLRTENNKLRRENDELRSNREEREFQIALAMEKNQRTNAGFQKLLQIGTVVAAKIGGGDGGADASSPLMMLVSEFGRSLRPDQMSVLTGKAIPILMASLDVAQKIMFMEIMNMITSPEPQSGESRPSVGPPNGSNGTASP